MTDTRDVERRLRADDEYQRRTYDEIGEGRTLSLDAANAIAAERAARERAEAALREVNRIGDNWYPQSLDASVSDAAVDAIGHMQSSAIAVLEDTTHER